MRANAKSPKSLRFVHAKSRNQPEHFGSKASSSYTQKSRQTPQVATLYIKSGARLIPLKPYLVFFVILYGAKEI